MATLNESEAKALLQKVLSYSKADECQVTLSGGRAGNLRFARNAVSTSGAADTLSIGVLSSFGKKSGTTSLNEFDDASLEKVVRRSEELARVAPENPEHVKLLGPQTYLAPRAYFDSTAGITPDFRAAAAAASINPCKAKGLTAAGFQQDYSGFTSVANSAGLFGYQKSSSADFSVTIRTADGKGSGYGVCDFNDVSKMDTGSVSELAIQKALRSHETKAIEPGKYTVILEPAASVDLIGHMISAMDARQTDEGRSFLSKPGGGSRLGEKLMDEQVTITSDPLNAEIPGDAWAGDGRPRKPVDWIKNGVVTNLAYERFWAEKNGIAGGGAPRMGSRAPSVGAFEGASGFIMAGGGASLDELVKSVKRGVLVTRMWYIRPVDPQTLLFTGLTRDGTFYVENGEIKYAIKNFRFNESPVIMLNNVEALGRPQRANGCLVPPMVLRDFTFSSLSDAV
ncbi:MAG: TldD/PmbA family protein [Undibacterium sp.]|nr:TldD/PmbA family protein [Opitutaceae bacterium]